MPARADRMVCPCGSRTVVLNETYTSAFILVPVAFPHARIDHTAAAVIDAAFETQRDPIVSAPRHRLADNPFPPAFVHADMEEIGIAVMILVPDLVLHHVLADRNGAIVGGLTREDFALSEDGRPQQISVFEKQSEMPLNLMLAIDTSGSVRKDLSEEAAAARRFAHAILRPQDMMSVLQFATNVKVLAPFTNKVSQIDRSLGGLRGDWATALYDSIYLGAQNLGQRDGRKVMVVISDGDDTVKNTTYAQALEQALRDEVMIYTIIDVPIEASAGRDTGGEHALITMAEQTGGKYFYVRDGGLDKAFAQVSDDLRTQYMLGYYPKDQEPGRIFHRIRVTVPRAATENFNIRHKTGYFSDSRPADE